MSAALERFGQNINEAQGARRALEDRSESADGNAYGAADAISEALQQDLQTSRAVLFTWSALSLRMLTGGLGCAGRGRVGAGLPALRCEA